MLVPKNDGNGRTIDRLETALWRGQIDRRKFVQLAIASGFSALAADAVAQDAAAVQRNQRSLAENLKGAYDYIVCGAGSSGSVVARRLAQDTSKQILLLEAGGTDDSPSILAPLQWYMNVGSERDWGYMTEPSPALNGRSIAMPMGKALGGGSSINAMVWARGHKNDFDGWADLAKDPNWSYEHVLGIYRRIEDWQGPADEKRRGKGGLVWVAPAKDPSPLAPAMVQAADSIGITAYDDQNGAMMEGVGGCAIANLRIRDGRRANIPASYLHPVMGQPNLTVLTGAQVRRVVLSGKKATSVEFIWNGGVRKIDAGREIILSMGAIQTPHVLMLSGIGDQAELKRVGLEVVHHLPGVGQNFQDHTMVGGCVWEPNEAIPARNNSAEATFFWKSDASIPTPDLQPFLIEIPYVSEVTGPQFKPPASCWSIAPGIVRPKSRGYLKLRSNRPDDKIAVFANSLQEKADVDVLIRGIELVRELGNSAVMKPFVKREAVPGPLKGAELEAFVRNGAVSYFHATCTCKMGHDDMAVVDNNLKIRGIDNLRIADGSIMPDVTTGNTMAPCVVIGERLAEILAIA
ncbi:GMC family oxidoreductase [Bradyrhizobium cosmicum]|uniref:Oxidoreductase n=1 Tax=Bradyrhizobium cosmicum TaxID=1404864 RepID=A0AAI8M8F0_9BRAD|nr:GMC family oxidoreductase N-terminal domain-containing protein [Bradyrhizobium cosmicum]BAL73906.1 oxidoreductase [Bradyrhizobium cosmicum]